jgi:hypothetical protein
MDFEDMKNGRPALGCKAKYIRDVAVGFALISPVKYINCFHCEIFAN